MEYTVELAAGGRITVVTDQTEIKIGDCVNVEQAGSGTANVRRVSSALCEAAASNTVDADIQQRLSESADMCLAAKERLLDADPLLERYCDPEAAHNLGLWILVHPDLKRTARVLAFRDHMAISIREERDLFESRKPEFQ